MSKGAWLLPLGLCLAGLEAKPPGPGNDPYAKRIAPASDAGMKAIPRIRTSPDLGISLFAAEPMLANPVAFAIDEKGRFYVAETFRLHHGVSDNRFHFSWLDDDIAARTVADRLAMYKKHLGSKYSSWGVDQDRIRFIEDVDGDGKADRAVIFADGFQKPEEGLGSGVLARGDSIWYTCIPNLWLLQGQKGRAVSRKALSTGYGVHQSFIGHDMHGLRFGPDGKLYFSIGDRGFNVPEQKGNLAFPDTGGVLRCNPDGTELEVVATGLRNPQELAFDKYGNLFTGDNNADSGDRARWVYVVEGGDSGWRIGFQYLNFPKALGPWNAEKLWHLPHEGQAAYIVPPLGHIASGPSGLTYNPGITLLPDRYRDHFFLCDFRGGYGNSGIHSFGLKPRGAVFDLVDRQQFAWSILATDCDFGPDGGFYLSDWVDGWNLPFKGRIYKIFDPGRVKDPAVAEVKKLLAEGMSSLSLEKLSRLLDHSDMRIRQEAQFALAEKQAIGRLETVAGKGKQLARIHAIWGLGQVGRKRPEACRILPDLTTDPDAEIRAQAVKVLGECRVKSAWKKLLPRLEDAQTRVAFFAALSLGKLGEVEAIPGILAFLHKHGDDPYLRHAGVMALAGIGDQKALAAAAHNPSPAIRLGALLAMRRLELPQIADFLHDTDPRLVLEAARAINDVPIPQAMPRLAELIREISTLTRSEVRNGSEAAYRDQLWQRILNAQYRVGSPKHAEALARFAAEEKNPELLRLEALRYLGEWSRGDGRDRVVGLWRKRQGRPMAEAREALKTVLGGIMTGPNRVREEAARLAARLGIKEIGPVLRELAADSKRPAAVRIAALRALEALKDKSVVDAASVALKDADGRIRHEARRLLLQKEKPEQAVRELAEVLEMGSLFERQGALALLAGLKNPAADRILEQWLDRLLAGKVPSELALDVREAASKRGTPALKKKLADAEAARPKGDPLAPFRDALYGGDAEKGRDIFLHKTEVSCLRCHKVNGQGGDVGPDLTGIGKKQKRDYLLEAIVDPNRQIAKGYETVVLALTNGKVQSGILKSENARELVLMTPEGQLIAVPKDQIDERGRGKSAMPEDIRRFLSPGELRDLVEFLAELKN